MISPIDPNWKDWIQTSSWAVAVIGLIVAILKYASEQRQNREQRAQALKQEQLELRWNQAEAAKKFLDEMHSDPRATAAMRMLQSGVLASPPSGLYPTRLTSTMSVSKRG